MSRVNADQPPRTAARADYGLDAPGVVRNFLIVGAIGLLAITTSQGGASRSPRSRGRSTPAGG